MSNLSSIRIDAPAKINLCLDILGRRDDGYHEIDTIMVTISYGDELILEDNASGAFSLIVDGRSEGVPTDRSNLVIRAASMLQERFGVSRGCRMVLTKRVAHGAGLGGGSSDAAAALVGLTRLWGLPAGHDELCEIASRIGSDVPFFIRGGAARCTGRGELVRQLSTRSMLHAVLVLSEPLSTVEVYRRLKITESSPSTSDMSCGTVLDAGDGVLDLARVGALRFVNALEAPARFLTPSIDRASRALCEAGAHVARMSGSGSCVFGIVSDADHAARIARDLNAAGLDAVAVRSVEAREL